MQRKAGFETREEKTGYNQYIDKWVIIYTPIFPSTSFSGRIDRIEEGDLVLNPFSDTYYSKEKGPIRRMSNKERRIPISPSPIIDIVSRRSLENLCEYVNKETKKHYQEEKERRSKKPNN